MSAANEELFMQGMGRNAATFVQADADADNKLDFNEFVEFVRTREEGNPTLKELRQRFQAMYARRGLNPGLALPIPLLSSPAFDLLRGQRYRRFWQD